MFILDDDALPTPNAISVAVKNLQKNHDLGIAALKIIDSRTGISPQTKFETIKALKDKKEGIPVKIFQGGGTIIKRQVFEEIGGFPENFFWSGEESDFAFRTILAGYEIRYFTELVVIHRASQMNRKSKKKIYYEIRNLIWLYWKYSPLLMAFSKSLYTISFYGIKAKKNQAIKYYIQGVLDGFKEVPHLIKHRTVVHTATIRYKLIELFK